MLLLLLLLLLLLSSSWSPAVVGDAGGAGTALGATDDPVYIGSSLFGLGPRGTLPRLLELERSPFCPISFSPSISLLSPLRFFTYTPPHSLLLSILNNRATPRLMPHPPRFPCSSPRARFRRFRSSLLEAFNLPSI